MANFLYGSTKIDEEVVEKMEVVVDEEEEEEEEEEDEKMEEPINWEPVTGDAKWKRFTEKIPVMENVPEMPPPAALTTDALSTLVKNYFHTNLNGKNFQDLQHGLFSQLISPMSSAQSPMSSTQSPFSFACANKLYNSWGVRRGELIKLWNSPPTQKNIFKVFKDIVQAYLSINEPDTTDKIGNEIRLISVISAKAAIGEDVIGTVLTNVNTPATGSGGVNNAAMVLDDSIDLGAAGLFKSLGFIVPRDEKGQTQARCLLENPGSSWDGGQCEHAYAAYGLQIHFKPGPEHEKKGTFHWGKLGETTQLFPVCCYMCREELTRGTGGTDMECEHKKPFMRGITDWSLLINSLFIDEYKILNKTKGAWKKPNFYRSLSKNAYIWLLLSSLEYGPSCKSCNQKTGKSNIPLKDFETILQKFYENSDGENEKELGSEGQYKPVGVGADEHYESGIINTYNFFYNKGEHTPEQKLLKFLFALSDDFVLEKIIGLYRRGKSVNPMQKVLNELKIVTDRLSPSVHGDTFVETISLRKQAMVGILESRITSEKNLQEQLEKIAEEESILKIAMEEGRDEPKWMERRNERMLKAIEKNKTESANALNVAKQLIIDAKNDIDNSKNLDDQNWLKDAIIGLNNFLKNVSVIKNNTGFLKKLTQLMKLVKVDKLSNSTIDKIIDFFNVSGDGMTQAGGGKGNPYKGNKGSSVVSLWTTNKKEKRTSNFASQKKNGRFLQRGGVPEQVPDVGWLSNHLKRQGRRVWLERGATGIYEQVGEDGKMDEDDDKEEEEEAEEDFIKFFSSGEEAEVAEVIANNMAKDEELWKKRNERVVEEDDFGARMQNYYVHVQNERAAGAEVDLGNYLKYASQGTPIMEIVEYYIERPYQYYIDKISRVVSKILLTLRSKLSSAPPPTKQISSRQMYEDLKGAVIAAKRKDELAKAETREILVVELGVKWGAEHGVVDDLFPLPSINDLLDFIEEIFFPVGDGVIVPGGQGENKTTDGDDDWVMEWKGKVEGEEVGENQPRAKKTRVDNYSMREPMGDGLVMEWKGKVEGEEVGENQPRAKKTRVDNYSMREPMGDGLVNLGATIGPTSKKRARGGKKHTKKLYKRKKNTKKRDKRKKHKKKNHKKKLRKRKKHTKKHNKRKKHTRYKKKNTKQKTKRKKYTRYKN